MNRSAEHTALVKELLPALCALPNVTVWQNSTGTAYRGDAQIRFGLVGSCDITGIVKINDIGFRLEIEVKTGKAVLSEQQKRFRKMILNHGGIHIVARSVQETITGLTQIIRVHEGQNHG